MTFIPLYWAMRYICISIKIIGKDSMKVVIYTVKNEEKEWLALANAKRHDLTLISNNLDKNTLKFAEGKDVVIVSQSDCLNAQTLHDLKQLAIQRIICRSRSTAHIDLVEAARLDMQVVNTVAADKSMRGMVQQAIRNLDFLENNTELGTACCVSKSGLVNTVE